MQAKQKSLLERVNALDEECEELQGQVGEREERQIVLHNQLLQMSEEKEQMQGQLTQQQVFDIYSAALSNITYRRLYKAIVPHAGMFFPTGPVFGAQKGEADAGITRRRAEEQCG